MKKIFTLLSLLISSFLEADVELVYLPNIPIEHESILTIIQSGNEEPRSTTIVQRLDASLLLKDKLNLPVSRPPFEMIFTLKDLNVEIKTPKKTIVFDVKTPSTSLLLAEIKDILGRPINLHFKENFKLEDNLLSLHQVVKELPLLGQLQPQAFLEGLFKQTFALAGREFVVGKTIVTEDKTSYHINSIDEEWIHATLSSEEENKTLLLDVANGKSVDITEKTTGKVRWKRSNALIYFAEIETTYALSTDSDGQTKQATLSMSHVMSSTPFDEKELP